MARIVGVICSSSVLPSLVVMDFRGQHSSVMTLARKWIKLALTDWRRAMAERKRQIPKKKIRDKPFKPTPNAVCTVLEIKSQGGVENF